MKKKTIYYLLVIIIVGVGIYFNLLKQQQIEIIKYPLEIDGGTRVENGMAIVKKNEKYGIVDIKGNYLYKIEFTRINKINKNLFVFLKNEELIIRNIISGKEMKIDEIQENINENIIVKKDKKYIVLNQNLDNIIGQEYDELMGNKRVIIVKKDKKFYFLDLKTRKERLIKEKYKKILLNSFIFVQKNNLWGIIDKNGQKIIEPKFSSFLPLESKKIIIGIKNNKKYFLNLETKLEKEVKYDNFGDVRSNKIMVIKDSKIGYLSLDGEEIIPLKYSSGFSFFENLVQLREDKKWFLLNYKTGEKTILDYDNIGEISDGMMIVEKDNKIGYINLRGKLKIPLKYELGESFITGNTIVAKESGFGIIDRKGRNKTDFVYDEIIYKNNFFYVLKNEKRGVLDMKGNTIIPIIYDELGEISENFILYKKKNEVGYLKLRNKK